MTTHALNEHLIKDLTAIVEDYANPWKHIARQTYIPTIAKGREMYDHYHARDSDAPYVASMVDHMRCNSPFYYYEDMDDYGEGLYSLKEYKELNEELDTQELHSSYLSDD
jgi:hypothetical protein